MAVPAAAPREKKVIAPEEWQRRLGDVKLSVQQMNALVMNFLVIEGHKDAAEAFAAESGTKPGIDLDSIADRMHIRTAVQQGRIKEAISRVNDINTEILDSRPELVFRLRLLQLIELIRSGDLPAALQFAQDELAPRAESSPELLEELERAMALLAVDTPDSSSPSGPLVDGTMRHKLASELNAAILSAQYQDQEPRLPQLLKLLLFSQSQLEEKCVFPKISLAAAGNPTAS